MKSWDQIPQLECDLNQWTAFRQSLVLRSSLTDWKVIWDEVKEHPAVWASGVNSSENSNLKLWTKLLQSSEPGYPAKEKLAAQALASLETWSGQIEQRLQECLKKESADSSLESLLTEVIVAAWTLAPASVDATLESFQNVLDTLLSLATFRLDGADDDSSAESSDQILLANVLSVELPLTLLFQLPDVPEVVSAANELPVRLVKVMDPCLDGNGLVAAKMVQRFPMLMASWTRVYQLGEAIESPILIDQTDDQYQWAVRQYLRMLRSDGTPMLTEYVSAKSDQAFLAAMLECSDDLEDWQAAQLAHPNSAKFVPADLKPGKEDRLPDAADESEWSKLALLRSKWKAKTDKLAVEFSQADVNIELENHRQWLSGPMQTELRINGQEAKLDDTWSEVCWHSDEDCVYLEIENELQGEVGTIQRQFMLARHYRFCLIADSVMLPETTTAAESSIDHHWSLPLADKVSFEAAKETHEGHLIGGKHQLSVLPLTLPEWRVEFSRGSLSAESHQLRTHYSLPANRLYQAVLIDLDHRRSRQPLTWRQLTVGESLQPVTVDRAAGFRVQLDRMQFLIYRSLAPIVGRTLLGHNYYCDFYAGQFQPNGFCEDILTINGPEES